MRAFAFARVVAALFAVIAAHASAAEPAASPAGAAGAATTPSDIARKQIEAGAARDWATLKTLYAPDVRYVDPNGEFKGVDAAIAEIEKSLKPFGKVAVKIHKIYDGKDFAIVEWTADAINDAEITLADGSTSPATGNEVNLNIVTIYDVKDGKITSERNYYDGLAMYGSLGLLGD
ncbi:MAG TPA: nuclear transport factor 2 family protein [Pseudomonadales bacterium]|nr:nuclear transport factor 2 family protein [Pseudomonadales bacterium]